jgi:DnaJ-class molecular chaperone
MKQDKWKTDKVKYNKRPCIECNATGEIEKLPCPFCEGKASLPIVQYEPLILENIPQKNGYKPRREGF